jgi:hypothetical protein
MSNTNAIKRLECCWCGQTTKGRQWCNREKGYGLCGKCAEKIQIYGLYDAEEFERNYGKKDVHWFPYDHYREVGTRLDD